MAMSERSQQWRERQRQAQTGKRRSKEFIENLRIKNTGKKRTPEMKERYRLSKLAEKNPNWIGDNVGYKAVHPWINRNFKKPDLCEICKKTKPYDLANVTGKYNREISNWKWLCRRCHMLSDGRFTNLWWNNREAKS